MGINRFSPSREQIFQDVTIQDFVEGYLENTPGFIKMTKLEEALMDDRGVELEDIEEDLSFKLFTYVDTFHPRRLEGNRRPR